MADEVANMNADAVQDVQNILAELKGEKEANDGKAPEANGNGATGDEEEEKRIIDAAKQLGETQAEKPDSRKKLYNGNSNRGHRSEQSRKNYRENIKSDLTSQELSDDPVSIRKQVEFYFSDSNLPMDKFLLSKVGGSKNHPVELTVIHQFKRMRHFQPFSAIVEALKSSEVLDVIDNDTKVRRKVPLPENVSDSFDPTVAKVFEDKAMARSIYAKGFGIEGPTTQFDIEAFFLPYGPTNAIRLRRTHDKVFKGSVFVEFDSEETQRNFLAVDPKPKWKGEELVIKSKKDYCEEKVREINAGRVKPNSFRPRRRDREDNRDWRERRTEDQKRGFNKGDRSSRHYKNKGQGQENGRDSHIEKDTRGVPIIHTDSTKDPSATKGQKRARDGEGDNDASNDKAGSPSLPPPKKVDTKEG